VLASRTFEKAPPGSRLKLMPRRSPVRCQCFQSFCVTSGRSAAGTVDCPPSYGEPPVKLEVSMHLTSHVSAAFAVIAKSNKHTLLPELLGTYAHPIGHVPLARPEQSTQSP
jgi:hypothetical protein